MNRIFKKIGIAVMAAIAGIIALGAFLLLTPAGAKLVMMTGLKHYARPEEVEVSRIQGSLFHGVDLDDIHLTDMDGLPIGAQLRIQKLAFNLDSLDAAGINGQIKNARLKMPDHEPVVVNGTIQAGVLDLNLFAAEMDFDLIREWLPRRSVVRKIDGDVKAVDLLVRGPIFNPRVTGSLVIRETTLYKVYLRNAPVEVDLDLKKTPLSKTAQGFIKIISGNIQFRKADVQLKESYVRFNGDLENPSLDIQGVSKVGETKIFLSVSGPAAKPDVNITSQPPYAKEKLVMMLVTGKEWSGLNEAFEKGEFSADLAKEFFDYFFLGDSGGGFLDKFGISDVSVKYQKDEKGIKGKTTIIPKTEIGLGVSEISGSGSQDRQIKQTLEGDVSVTDTVSVGVSKEVQRPAVQSETSETIGSTEEKVLLKYKKKF